MLEGQRIDPDYYHDGRLHLYRKVIDFIEDGAGLGVIVRPAGESVLEIGPYRLPLFEGSAVLDWRRYDDVWGHPINDGERPFYCRDAGAVPWPFADKQFDLVVALQVFEHFGKVVDSDPQSGWYGQIQPMIFKEVERIANHAIISLPWLWKSGDLRHRVIGPETVKSWFPWPAEYAFDVDGRRCFHFDFTVPKWFGMKHA